MEGQPFLHALEHLVVDLHAHPGRTHHGQKPPQNLEKQTALKFNQSAIKNMALSTEEEPNQTMDGWIQIGSCAQIHKKTFCESNPENNWIHPKQMIECSPTEGMN